MKKMSLRDFTMIGILAALSYVCFTFIQFKITLPGGDATSVHLGNMVPVLGALLFGGLSGGLGGAIGMTIGDLFDPIYVIYAPKTFLLKLCIGLISGKVAHSVFHLEQETDRKKLTRGAAWAAAAGLGFNAVFDPIIGYFYKLLILGKPAAEITLAWNVFASVTNAVISTLVAVPLYIALRPALRQYMRRAQESISR
jgi:uncharacterized membrane protein